MDEDQDMISLGVSSANLNAFELKFPSEDWSNITESAKDLVSRLLNVDHEKRITAEAALKHAW
jgi:serine/threonine protein kinase